MTRTTPVGAGRLRLPGTRHTISRADAEHVWDAALCAETDPELFFPEKGQARQSREARAVCGRCDVQALCLATFGPLLTHGVVGGCTEQQRRQARPPAGGAVAA